VKSARSILNMLCGSGFRNVEIDVCEERHRLESGIVLAPSEKVRFGCNDLFQIPTRLWFFEIVVLEFGRRQRRLGPVSVSAIFVLNRFRASS